MGYIVAGANLSNLEAPGAALTAATASVAMEKVSELREKGYHVRVSTSEGDEVLIPNLLVLAASEAMADVRQAQA